MQISYLHTYRNLVGKIPLQPKNTMSYIIYVRGVPQPYITNDPRIYIDCLKLLKWECESRPFHDAFCKELRANEDEQSLADRRRDQLEAF